MGKKIGKFVFPQGTQLEQIAEALRHLGLRASASSFEFYADKMIKERATPYDFLQNLLEHEYTEKEEERTDRWISQAKIPEVMRLEEYEFDKQPSIDPVLIHELASCRFIKSGKNVLLLGGAGVGKTHLATALGCEAIDNECSVRYMSHNEFDGAINRAADSSIPRLYRSLMIPDLLILDDLDYFNTNEESSKFLFDVIKQRFELKLSMIVTSNSHPAEWDSLFGTTKKTGVIADRLMDFRCRVIINIDGPSYRVPEAPVPSKPESTSIHTDNLKERGLLKKIGVVFTQKSVD